MESERIDKRALLELKELLEDEFEELIETYISDTSTKLNEIKESLDDSDIDQTRKLAHSIKGASVNIGVMKLSALCSQIEESAIDNALSACRLLFESALEEFNIVNVELIAFV